MEPKPEDLRPIGWVMYLTPQRHETTKVVVSGHVWDPHALGGWGYALRWVGLGPESDSFFWPHDSQDIWEAHPLEHLADTAE